MSAVRPKHTLVVSPHLDDAVLSCGDLLSAHPHATVVTVFAGTPSNPDVITDWDIASGFSSAGEAMRCRREEDRAALQMLGATPRWLDFLDSQYGSTPSTAALSEALRNVIDDIGPAEVLCPAGLFHSDHVLVHEAMMDICPSYPRIKWLMYEEASYRRIPGLVQCRLRTLLDRGWQATPAPEPACRAQRKRDALQCYASQLRALQATVRGGYRDAFAAERSWPLERSAPT
jgi:LmbE family N-acetylglucosaminyl deacetylase